MVGIRQSDRRAGRRSWLVTALVVIGIGLIVMPAIFQMFSRAPKGATMISAFRPYMTLDRLAGYQRDMREIDAGVRQSNTQVAAQLVGTSGRRVFDKRFPDFAAFESQWGGIYRDMSSMLRTIQRNRGNYQAVAALPKFTLFPWFFVAPGVLILGLLATLRVRPDWWRSIRWALVAIGIGLVAAPVAFEMFTRAPKGERMVNAFKTIETQKRVETIQGYFGSMAVGQGAVRLELIPALERSGLSREQIASRFPAVDALDTRWVHILNDMTPMIGVMSDNVGNYDAVASLPPFGLFPWFFVLPGLLIAGLAVAAGPRLRRPADSAARPASALDGSLPEGAS